MTLKIAFGLDKHRVLFSALSVLCEENKGLKELLLQKEKPQNLKQKKNKYTTSLNCRDGQEKSLKFLTKPIRPVLSLFNNSLDESKLGNLFCTVLIGCGTIPSD